MEYILRQPRPLGTTMMSINLRKEQDIQKKERLRERLIQGLIDQYTTNGMEVNNRSVPIEQYANFLGVDIGTMMRRMNRVFEKVSNIFDNGESRVLARVSLFKALKNSQETAQIAKSQSLLLLAQQGGEYVPFLSSAVNQSITNLIASNKPTIETLKLLMEGNSANNSFFGTQNVQQNIYLTPDEAIKILTEKGTQSLLTDDEALQEKDKEIRQLGAPEVGAKYQDLSTIGIRFDGTQNKELDEENDGHNIP